MKLVVLICLVVALMECTNAVFIKNIFSKIFHKKKECSIPERCNIKLMAFEKNKNCRLQRQKEIAIARHFYQITEESSPRGTEFPLTQVPWLNQTIQNTGLFFAMDDFEGSFIAHFKVWLKIVDGIKGVLHNAFKDKPYETNAEFIGLYQILKQALLKQNQAVIGGPGIYSDSTNHIMNSKWRTDEAFAQRRLSFDCPFTLRKVVNGDDKGIQLNKLAKVMNPKIKELKFNIGKKSINFNEAINQGRLFIQYLEDMDDVPTQIDTTPRKECREMMEVTSPISYFILNSNGMLSPVAIQIDSQTDADVFTPSDGDKWAIAKSRADFIQFTWCQSYVHFGEIHLITTVYCLSFRRHLSEKHPLYEFFKFHCEGTVPHITLSYTTLTSTNSSGERFFAIGEEGIMQLGKKAFQNRKYGKLSFENTIKAGGMDDERIKYYPYRDDTKLIISEYKRFASALVNQYYGGKSRDLTSKDEELQSWAKELSQGAGRLPGFPSSIKSRKTLEEFIVNFLWINVVHTTTNYPMSPSFVPITPPKLYQAMEDTPALTPDQIFMNGDAASRFTAYSTIISNFRINRIFDYYDKVKDKKFGELVRKSYHRMHGCVQKKMSKRNAERKKKDLLGYQLLEPRWLTNSIHI